MSSNIVTFDPSQAQPIKPPSGGDSSMVTFDPSQAQPITPAIAQPSGGGLGGWAERNLAGSPEEQAQGWGSGTAAGFVKSAGSGIGNILDYLSTVRTPSGYRMIYKAQHPQATDQEIDQAFAKENARAPGSSILPHIQNAARWLREDTDPHGWDEHLGAIGEQYLEAVSGEGMLNLAGKGLRAGEAVESASKAAMSAERLKNTQDLFKTLGVNKKAAGYMAIGIDAVRNASIRAARAAGIGGAQTLVHTGDPEQAQHAAELGGGLSTLMEPVVSAGRYLMRNAPQMVERLGQRFPVLATQLTEPGGAIMQGNVATEAPAIYEAQQGAMPGAVQNLAQRAVTNAVGAINEGRPVYEATQDTSRMLPAPEGSKPFTFTLGTTPAEEGAQGPLTTPAQEMERSAMQRVAGKPTEYGRVGTEPEYLQPAGPGGAWSERKGQSWAERRAPGYTSETPEGRADEAHGGGALQDTDPRKAIQWVTDLERLQESDAFENMPEAQQKAVNDHVKSLNDQLGLYYSSPYAQRFGPEDLPGMLDKVRDFGDAQAQLEHAAKPVYAVMDHASDGEFSKWNNQYKLAQKVLRRPSTIEAAENAQARMDEASQNILGLLDRHRDAVSFDDYLAAKNTWRQSARLGELHSLTERMMNGVTLEESEKYGLQRLMKRGSVEGLENYLAKDTNRRQVEQLIGADGVANLKEMTGMFSSAKNNRSMQRVGRNVADYMMQRGWIAKGIGGMAGGAAGHLLGMSPYEGSIAGATTVEGLRTVLRYAAVNPRIGNMLMWAAEHDVDPRIYVPLIGRAIREPFNEQKKPQEQGQEEPATAAQ